MVVLPDQPSVPSTVEPDLIPQSVVDLVARLRAMPTSMPEGELHCDHHLHPVADAVPAEDWGQ